MEVNNDEKEAVDNYVEETDLLEGRVMRLKQVHYFCFLELQNLKMSFKNKTKPS